MNNLNVSCKKRPNWIGTVRKAVNFALGKQIKLDYCYNDPRSYGRRIKFYCKDTLTSIYLKAIEEYITAQKPGVLVKVKLHENIKRGSLYMFGNYAVHLSAKDGGPLPE